jgi:hypothetical protein
MDEMNLVLSMRKLFSYYKGLGEKAIEQLDDSQINWKPNEASNSVSLIVHHLSGNMISRFTDFLTSDGEKEWRNREAEFEVGYNSKTELIAAWENGWRTLFSALDSLQGGDLSKIVYIRNEGQPVIDALQRQLAHYPHHIGQIIYIAKALKGDEFKSLSIPRGGSSNYNAAKFSQDKSTRHFTDRV